MLKLVFSCVFLLCVACLQAQNEVINGIDTTLEDHTVVNKKKLRWLVAGGAAGYIGASTSLYFTWYKDYPQSGFHLHNDWGEWRHMDKLGHGYAAYQQADLIYQVLGSTGLSDKSSMTYAIWSSLIAQSTIEVMDGFSTEWGFSLLDMGANLLGVGSFALQQHSWGEQRVRWKNSYSHVDYPEGPLLDRAQELYGHGFTQRWLKDYNGQTTWLSVNIKSFLPETVLPSWLNVAVGYGVENLYGGYQNQLDVIGERQQRYSQFYISLDADLSKIETSSSFVRTVLDVANILKVPFSTIEINTLGEVKFHILRF